jgi:hypothetical protein
MGAMIEVAYTSLLLIRLCRDVKSVRFFKRNTGILPVDGRYFHASTPGMCDMYGISVGHARHYEIEVKNIKTPWRRGQREWRDLCAANRWPWLLLRVARAETTEQTLSRWVDEVKLLIST